MKLSMNVDLWVPWLKVLDKDGDFAGFLSDEEIKENGVEEVFQLQEDFRKGRVIDDGKVFEVLDFLTEAEKNAFLYRTARFYEKLKKMLGKKYEIAEIPNLGVIYNTPVVSSLDANAQ